MQAQRRVLFLLMLTALTACASDAGRQTAPSSPRPMSEVMTNTVADTGEGAWEAVQEPFEDLNLKQKPIPPMLQQIVRNPYAMPDPYRCDVILQEIAALDRILGPDSCTIANPTGAPAGYTEQAAGLAREQAVGMVSSQTSILPFRGVIRRVSGAQAYARAFEHAYEAGKARRSFLRGLATALGPSCMPPTTPQGDKPLP